MISEEFYINMWNPWKINVLMASYHDSTTLSKFLASKFCDARFDFKVLFNFIFKLLFIYIF